MLFGLSIVIIFLFLIFLIGEKKAFEFFFALCIMGCQYSILGSFTIEDVLILVFLLMTFRNGNIKTKSIGYPFFACTALYSVSTMLSAIYTKIAPHYGIAITDCLRVAGLPYLFFYYVRTKSDIRFLVQLLVGIAVFGISLAVIEEISQEKIYLNMIRSYVGTEVGWEMTEARFGFTRAQAFCLQSVSYGYICMTLLSAFLLLFYKFRTNIPLSNLSFMLILISCIFGCLLCGSRSGIFPLAICLFYFYAGKSFSLRNLTILFIAFIAVMFVYGNYIDDIWNSIFNSDKENIGSSSEMRMNQLDISLFYFWKSPILGMGTFAIFDLVRDRMGEAILGGESVWFGLLINKGILGCVAYIFLYVSSFRYLRGIYRFEAILFLALQLMCFTITSTPGYDASIFLCMVILAHKMQTTYGYKSAIVIDNKKI